MRIDYRRGRNYPHHRHIHRAADTGLGSSNIVVGVARDEEEAYRAVQRQRSLRARQAQEALEDQKMKVTLPVVKGWT